MAGIYEPCCGHDHGAPPAPEPPQVQAPRPDTALLGTGTGLLRELEASSGDSIEARFIAGQCLYQHVADGAELDGCDAGSHDVAAHVSQALRIFLGVARSVREESVFSDNERAKDMRNDDLQLLLTEFYIGALKQLERTVSADQRYSALQSARASFDLFLRQVVKYGALSASDREVSGLNAYLAALERGEDEEEEEEEEEEAAAARGGSGASSRSPGARTAAAAVKAGRKGVDPSVARAQKIARFKSTSAAKKRLQELTVINARRVAAARKHGTDIATALADDGIGATLGGAVIDEDDRRESIMLALRVAVNESLDALAAIHQELPILAHMRVVAPSRDMSGTGAEDERQKRRAPPADDIALDPKRPGLEIYRIDPTMNIERETVRADVFTSSFAPPSMTLEEWGEVVTQKRIVRDDLNAETAKSRVRTAGELYEAGEEDNEAAWDAAQERARAFDDWADGVPKGSGVTKRV